uniref:molybdopterin cofactor-binding domain-containing protein n=1 Tax=Leisingera sp. F5 TaxID=1813816 RepID=UPI000AA07229
THNGVTLLRPLLDVTRCELRDYLQTRGIAWSEDPSNEDTRFERVRVRRALEELAPLGLTAAVLAKIARNMAKAREALDWYVFLAARDLAHAAFARSTVAHGLIKSINTAAAEAMPGVLAVFTGQDFADVGGNPAGWLINSRDGTPMKEPKRPVLAHGKVRHVGDAYAAVIAETKQQAMDAVEAIEIEIEELPAIVDVKAALSGDNFVHDEIETNQCFDWGWIEDNRQATDEAIKNAHHVTTLELVNNRLVPNAMEPRSSIGAYKESGDEYTLHTTSQNPHLTRLLISAFVMGIPENKLTVIAPDVGGGFGSKIYHYGEEALVLAAAKRTGRTVKWTADRSESFLT